MFAYLTRFGRAMILAYADEEAGQREYNRLISLGWRESRQDEYEIVRLVEAYGSGRVIEIATKHAPENSPNSATLSTSPAPAPATRRAPACHEEAYRR